MKTKKNIESTFILLIFLFISIGFCSVWVASTIGKYQLLEKISQDYYTNQAHFFTIGNSNNSIIKLFANSMRSGDILYKPINDNIKAIITKGNASSPPITEGRFYEEQDFFAGKYLALVGQDLMDQLEIKNGIKYFKYEGYLFEVIGILGIDIPSKLDKMVFLNMDAIVPIIGSDGYWVLDGKGNVKETFKEIKQEFTEQGYKIKELDRSMEGTRRLFRNENIFNFIHIAIFFCLISCVVSISYYRVERRRSIIAIQKLCGYTHQQIFWDFFKTYFLIMLPSYAVGNLVALITLSIKPLTFSDLISIYIMVTLSCMVVCLIPLIFMILSWTDRILRSV